MTMGIRSGGPPLSYSPLGLVGEMRPDIVLIVDMRLNS